MRANRFAFPHLTVIISSCALLIWPGVASCATEKIIHTFRGSPRQGAGPVSGLIADAKGNLYGTAIGGGNTGLGTVFKLSPNSSGGWTETVLYSFKGASDGTYPQAGLVFDKSGNLYGTTYEGGKGPCDNSAPIGCGTVFKLAPNSSGGWTETVIHAFDYGSDGAYPTASLTLDADGNIYGTTSTGGQGLYSCCGTVFKLTPASGGGWTESVLYVFPGGSAGSAPSAPVIFDPAGNLYGTASSSGAYNNGVVFELTPNSQGMWSENVLYSFGGGNDGTEPEAGLIFDSVGNLYGTTKRGGQYGSGTVFELQPNGSGGWNETILHSFGQASSDGSWPLAGVTFDKAGNLFGTTSEGGYSTCNFIYSCGGVAFQLTPSSGGQWTENILHAFSGGIDGGISAGGVILDQAGNVYGTTQFGGAANLGAVFELTRGSNGTWTDRTIHWFPGSDGNVPDSTLIFDNAGSFYGTTVFGGVYQQGTVFKLSPNGSGGWNSSLLYSFRGAPDGAKPYAGVVFDTEGNLYGTTSSGGTPSCAAGSTCGTVFKVTPSAGGKWTESVLYSFTGGLDGEFPNSSLTWHNGRLYGTTTEGGGGGTGCYGYGCGVVFQLSPSASGPWTEKVIYTFTGGIDNGLPLGPLAVDASGNLYGTTTYGGCDGCFEQTDTVFEVSPHADGSWTEREIYFFTALGDPGSGVVSDAAGNLYGAIYSNQMGGNGSVFKLTPSKGLWTLTTLYGFTGGADGAEPDSTVLFDGAGNIYGVTFSGGDSLCLYNYGRGCGVVYKLAPGSGGQYTYSVLHRFTDSPDGAAPYAGLIFDAAGNIYGTTGLGGAGYGTVFEITP